MRGVEGDTKELLFDLSASPAHTVTVGNHEYEIRLLHIGEVEEEGQKQGSQSRLDVPPAIASGLLEGCHRVYVSSRCAFG